jgi:peroxiredoxin
MNVFKHLLVIGSVLILVAACKPKADHAASAVPPDEKKAGDSSVQKAAEKVPADGLPPITLIEENGGQFSATTLPGNSILIFFSSDCDHCQREATEIEKNLAGFKNYHLFFISMNPFPAMKKFAETYKINNHHNIKFFRADGKTVFDALGSIQTPTICVYNSDKKLVKKFDGETKVDDILNVL